MSFSAKAMIKERKSVRSFDGRLISDKDRTAMVQYIQTVQNPFEVPVEFKLLHAKDHDLSSPVVTGADEYIAAKVTRSKNFEIGYGYSFESVCLYA